jgi:hypothetical protein
MAIDSTKPTWIEPPPPRQSGLGCMGKGCLVLAALGVLALLIAALCWYLFSSGGSKPTALPVQELPPEQMADVQQRINQFEATPSTPSYTPPPTTAPAGPNEAGQTPPPAGTPAADTGRQLILSAAEINGLISANPKSRGHAFVSLSGNTATVQVSIPSAKVPGLPGDYLNGSFTITTDGPTPISALQVSKIQANRLPVPSGVLSMSYRGNTLLGYAMEAAAPYNVSTAEIRDGVVVLH